MIREIKFKFWLSHTQKMTYEHSLIDIAHLHWDFTKDIIPLQYTGLKDKNGKEIYEGDILENDNGIIYTVVWIEQISGFYLQQPNTHRGKEIISCAASKVANEPMLLFKEAIIGNIYENPELLEIKKSPTTDATDNSK